MSESCLSQASLVRQISREGKRWGLVPVIHPVTGAVRVAEMVHVAEARFGVGVVSKRPDRIIATVDDDAPFHEVLRNRIDNGEVDLARRARLVDEIEAREQAKREAENHAETMSIWSSRRRSTMLPSGFVPSGLTNRRNRP